MVAFIDDHRVTYGVEPICQVLPIAPSTYYEQKARQTDASRLPPRTQRDATLRPEIERVWRANRRLWREEGLEGVEARADSSGAVHRGALDG